MFSTLQDTLSDKDIIKDKIDSFKSNLKNLSIQKEEYNNKYVILVDKRNDILSVT